MTSAFESFDASPLGAFQESPLHARGLSAAAVLVAVSNNGTHRAMTSPDGITWTAQTKSTSGVDIAYSAALGRFVSIAGGAGSYSDDGGVTWSACSGVPSSARGICWSPELALFVIVGGTTTAGQAASSADGITFTSRTAGANVQWNRVCWSPALGLFCAVGLNGFDTKSVQTSSDGISWTAHINTNAYGCVAWSPSLGLFAAVSNTLARVSTSPDGSTWTDHATADSGAWTDVVWSIEQARFVAVGSGGSNKVIVSTDGVTWTGNVSAEAHAWSSVTWSKNLGLFIAVAGTGSHRVQTSPDGVTWTTQSAAEANAWQAVETSG